MPEPYECPDCEEEHVEGECPENRLSLYALRHALASAAVDAEAVPELQFPAGFAKALHERLKSYTSEPGIFCTPCDEGDGYAKHCAGCGRVF